MNLETNMKWLLFLFLLLNVIPDVVEAGIAIQTDQAHTQAWQNFNNVVDRKILEIKSLAFGPLIRIAGVAAIAYGLVQLFCGRTGPIIMYGGIGLLLNILPTFIDSVFGAMLPR